MKDLFVLLLFLTISAKNTAQVTVESLQEKISLELTKTNLDSPLIQLTQLPDSLLPSYYKLDSIRTEINSTTDSIRNKYQDAVSKIEEEKNIVNNYIDSLRALNLPVDKSMKRLDSLDQLLEKAEAKASGELNALKSHANGKLKALNLPTEYNQPLQQITNRVNTLTINSGPIGIAEMEIPGYSLPKIEGLNGITSRTAELGSVSKMPDIETDVGNVIGQVKAYEQDVRNITEGNVNDVNNLPKTIEEHASKIDGMNELEKQSTLIDGHRASLEDLKNMEKAKRKAVEMGRKAAVQYFGEKQEQLKAAMDKMSRYKQRYPSVSSMKDLPKRLPNAMKFVPLVERFVPGLYFQYQRKNLYLVDVNPYLGYRVSGRITTGLGWNHRYAYDKDNNTFDSRSRIFGPRGYVDFKLGKGFIAHLEGESMNTFVPSTLRGNPDTGQREWVWSFLTGLKKEYKIYKNLKGTALIQYNWFNRYYKAPYVDRLNSRIGFEYVIKKQSGKGKRQQAEKAHFRPAKAQGAD
jgi:hypothetical protein